MPQCRTFAVEPNLRLGNRKSPDERYPRSGHAAGRGSARLDEGKSRRAHEMAGRRDDDRWQAGARGREERARDLEQAALVSTAHSGTDRAGKRLQKNRNCSKLTRLAIL